MPPFRPARRSLSAVAATGLAAAALGLGGSSAQAQPCRDFCDSFDPFSFSAIFTTDYWAYNRAGVRVHWYETHYRAPNGQTIRTCGYTDEATGRSVSDTCPY
jgi:hypothetical protein